MKASNEKINKTQEAVQKLPSPLAERRRSEVFLILIFLAICFAGQAQAQKKVLGSNDTIRLEVPGKQVSGYIKDAATGKGVVGGRISYGTIHAAITDSIGKFSIKVPDERVTIRVDADGYQSKEIALKGRQHVDAVLYENGFHSLYGDVVLPFETVPQSNVTVAATSIQTNGAWNNIPETPDNYLQGKVAGMNVVRRSGTPGIGANLFLRGYSSLYATNQPLIVVDGVIFDNSSLGESIISGFYQNALSTIDLKDIDNITVIKDGSSTYGTKGANGVVLITTARSTQEATRIDVGIYGGVNLAPANTPVLNASDYRIYLSEMLQSQGVTAGNMRNLPYMNDDKTSNPDYYRYHNQNDWQKTVLKNSSSQNGYVKVTGGDNVAKYALTMGFLKNGGIVDNTSLSRYNTRFNADFHLSPKLTAAANIAFTYSEQQLKNMGTDLKTNPIYNALVKAPFLATNNVDNIGTASPTLADKDVFNVSNPLAIIQNMQAFNKSYRFVGSLNLNYAFSNKLAVSTVIGINMEKIRESFFIPQNGIVPDTLINAIANNQSGAQVLRMFNVNNDTKITYNNTFNGIHHLAVRAGVRYTQSRTEQDEGFGFNSATDQLTGVGYGLNSLRQIGGSLGNSKWLNTYFNTDYNLLGKYFLSLNVAMDGSSRFGGNANYNAVHISGSSYAVMPSLSGAWLVSSENFMAKNKWLDLLKIRGSIGLSGNDDIGNFTSQKTYVSQNLLGIEGLVRGNVGNPTLQWESISRLNAGLDISVLKERLSLSFDVFQSTTKNMIVYEPAPAASGMNFSIANSGGMQTTGIELSLNARVLNQKNLKWDIGFNIAHNKSLVTKLPVANIMTNYADGTIITQVGSVPNLFYGYKTNGIYNTAAAASADGLSIQNVDGSTTPFKAGDVRFVNTNSTDKIIDANDRQVIGNPNPNYFGGIYSTVKWKRFTFDALFTFSQGNDVYNYTRRQLETMGTYANQTQAVINRWKTDGQVTNMPKATWNDPMGNARFSDRWIEDGSYFRLRTLSVSYQIPIKHGALKYIVLYLNGNNVFTLTKYLGYDPEFSASTTMFGQGVDNMAEPQYRTVQTGVKIGL